ncbi:MAG: hypothetical protein ABIL18_08740 [candidate division WOR-3 bacterium]
MPCDYFNPIEKTLRNQKVAATSYEKDHAQAEACGHQKFLSALYFSAPVPPGSSQG